MLHGKEDYLISRYIENLVKDVQNKEFNIAIFHSTDDMLAIIEACYQLPLMDGKRYVIVYGNVFKGETKILEEYIENPVESTLLVLIPADVDKRKKLYKLLEKNGIIEEFKKLIANDIKIFIKEFLISSGATSDESTITAIIENSAYLLIDEINLHDVVSEIEKLISYVGEKGTISANDVKAIIKPPSETNVFKLFPLIASKTQ